MLKLLKKHAYGFIMKITRDRIDASSAQAAFFIMISFIPFLMFLLSVLQLVHISGTSILNNIIMLLPEQAANLVSSLFRQTSGTQITILSVTAVTTIWTASTAMYGMLKSLNLIFNVNVKANYFKVRGMAILYTVVFTLVLIITIALYVFADPLYTVLVEKVNETFAKFLLAVKNYVGFSVLFLFFLLSFKAIPRKAKIRFRFAFIGALISTLGWIIFSRLFSLYVENFSNYASIYGSLTAIVIVMLWLYFLMNIMFISAEIVAWVQMSSLRRDFNLLYGDKRRHKSDMRVLNRLEKKHMRGKTLKDKDMNRLLILREKLTGDKLPPDVYGTEIFPGQKAPDLDEIAKQHKDSKQQKMEKKKHRVEQKLKEINTRFDNAPESYLDRVNTEFHGKTEKPGDSVTSDNIPDTYNQQANDK